MGWRYGALLSPFLTVLISIAVALPLEPAQEGEGWSPDVSRMPGLAREVWDPVETSNVPRTSGQEEAAGVIGSTGRVIQTLVREAPEQRVPIFKARAWVPETSFPGFAYPEEELDIKGLRGRSNSALCFSGGGVRSFVSSLGYLAGLNQLGLLAEVCGLPRGLLFLPRGLLLFRTIISPGQISSSSSCLASQNVSSNRPSTQSTVSWLGWPSGISPETISLIVISLTLLGSPPHGVYRQSTPLLFQEVRGQQFCTVSTERVRRVLHVATRNFLDRLSLLKS